MNNEQKEYIIAAFEGDSTELAKLFRSEYGDNSFICNPVFLEWQYFQNPQGKAIIVGTRDAKTNELVGVYIVNPTSIVMQQQTVSAALSLNTFTRKDFRGLGLFPKMAKLCYALAQQQGVQCIIGFPNPASFGGFVNKLQFTNMGEVEYLIKPLNLLRTGLRRLFKRKPLPIENIFNSALTTTSTEYQITDLMTEAPELLANFWAKHTLTHQILGFRSVEVFKWRYLNNPVRKYRLLSIKSEDEIKAVLVINIIENKMMIDINIVDFCMLNDTKSKKAATFLLKNTLKILAQSGADIVKTYTQKNSIESNLLETLYFMPQKRFFKNTQTPFIFRPLTADLPIPDFKNWYIVLGDGDVS